MKLAFDRRTYHSPVSLYTSAKYIIPKTVKKDWISAGRLLLSPFLWDFSEGETASNPALCEDGRPK
jgi:hypothetical protein